MPGKQPFDLFDRQKIHNSGSIFYKGAFMLICRLQNRLPLIFRFLPRFCSYFPKSIITCPRIEIRFVLTTAG